MIDWQWLTFEQLDGADLYQILALRQQVFILEQACLYPDIDGHDQDALHLLGWRTGGSGRTLVAYLRCLAPGAKQHQTMLGRVLTAPAVRATGIGRQLLAQGIANAARQFPGQPIRIGAQQRLQRFYQQFGFATLGAPYDEDGIAHIDMLRPAEPAPDQPSALMSWSGGKDSCLALWRARRAGLNVALLVTAMDESGARARSHGVPPELLQAQAASLGARMRFYQASWDDYEACFIETLRAAALDSIGTAIFGDIDLLPHRAWEERVCAAAGLTARLPLWGESRRALVDEFLAAGFKAIVVCVNGKHLSADFCGREFDAAFLADLPPGVDACGENGEFHTFVYDGPAFAAPVALRRVQVARYQSPPELGGATYYFQQLAAQ
jgi:uncharacterized protein (TIGR00290 family)